MNAMGAIHLASAVYLSFIVAGVISINENDDARRTVRETLRRAGKLLGVLLIAGLIVQTLTFFSGN